ncbi:MAG: hypothetical protein GKR87_08620 [Kiritimatiellae bacterium]|nr:hypothetical protein [Kiritimatiellia bacterium]
MLRTFALVLLLYPFSAPNASAGVRIEGRDSTIGGSNALDRNIISRNLYGIHLTNVSATGNTIIGNYIGTDSSGTIVMGNTSKGIFLENGAHGNTVGADTLAAGNVIGGSFVGVEILAGSGNNKVLGNQIGSTLGGRTIPNITGVFISGSSSNVVGGLTREEGNLIVQNTFLGVNITTGDDNGIVGNVIYDNPSGSISLSSGGNESQVAPVITNAINDGTNTIVTGTFDASLQTTYRLEFFANSSCSGGGEAERFLGAEIHSGGFFSRVTNFSAVLPLVPAGDWVSAIATKTSSGFFIQVSHNDTSEISLCVPIALLDDADMDGVPDQWEVAHGSDTNINDSGDDLDGDSFTTYEEYVWDTVANNSNSFPQITSVSNTSDDVMVSFPSSSNRFFKLQANENLTDTNGWQSLSINAVQEIGGTQTIDDPDADSFGQRSYRITGGF